MSEPSLNEEDYIIYNESDDFEEDEIYEEWPEIGQFYTPKQRTWEGTYE